VEALALAEPMTANATVANNIFMTRNSFGGHLSTYQCAKNQQNASCSGRRTELLRYGRSKLRSRNDSGPNLHD
jgi:hypothetical protein